MKWFRRIFGTPTRDEFAQLVLDTHLRSGSGTIQYDPEHFQIFWLGFGSERSSFISLHDTYVAYAAARPWQRGRVLRRILGQARWATSWEEIAPRLYPGLRDTWMYESLRLQSRLKDLEISECARRTFAGRLCVALLEDHPDQISPVSPESLQAWGVSFDEALATALANLEEASAPRRWTSPFPGVYVSAWQDDYDTSRLLLADILSGLELSGVPVALVPNRNCLILTGAEDDEAVSHAMALAASEIQASAPLSLLPLRHTPSGWEPWEIGDNHPHRRNFQQLRLHELRRLYGDQKRLLEALQEKEETGIFVASYFALEHKTTGQTLSSCTWTRGIISLLPRTDEISFCDLSLPEGQQVRGTFDWETVEAHCGHLMKQTDDLPPRYRVDQDAFPTDEDFAAMGSPAA